MKAPALAAGDGALGFWKALRDTWPETKEQRCWFHKTGNVLNDMLKSAHPTAKKMITDIWNAEDKQLGDVAIEAFKAEFGAKYPKAVAKITNDRDELLAFFDFPAEHWKRLRTTNPIESTFSTVRLRTRVTKRTGFTSSPALQCVSSSWNQRKPAGMPSPHRTLLRSFAAVRSSKGGVLVEGSVTYEETEVKVPA